MNFNDLRSYDYWVGKTALYIKQSVMCTVKGWEFVFPSNCEMPTWANKVRNYFNEIPTELACVGKKTAKRLAAKLPYPGIIADFALPDGDDYPFVFIDRNSTYWYLMKPSGGAYHVGDGSPSAWEKFSGLWKDQKDTIFKLVAPDTIGGSSEVIIKNPQGISNLGNTDMEKWEKDIQSSWFSVANDIDFNDLTRGTYNYSETLTSGFNAHDHRDIKPHEKMSGVYLRPPRPSALQARIFPETIP